MSPPPTYYTCKDLIEYLGFPFHPSVRSKNPSQSYSVTHRLFRVMV